MISIRTLVGAALVSAAVLAAASSQASANLIEDGNFNGGPTPTASDLNFINYSTTIDGVWNILDNNVDVVASVSPAQPWGWSTPSGACCSVDLVGTGTTGGIDQSFTAKTTGTYTLSFYYGNNFWSTNTASANVEVGTSAGGSSLFLTNITHSSSSQLGMNWTFVSYTFDVSNPGTLWLSFDTTFGFNDGGIALTDVNMVDGSSTPLPAAFSLFAGGLGVIGLISRRRNRKRTIATSAA